MAWETLTLDARRRINGALNQFDGLYRRMARDCIHGPHDKPEGSPLIPWNLHQSCTGSGYVLMRADADWNGEPLPIVVANVQGIGRATLRDRLVTLEVRAS